MDNEIPGNIGTGPETVSGTAENQENLSEKPQETGESKPERTFTKAEVNELMKKRVGRSHSAFFNRYGVKDLDELDKLFGQSNSYGPLKQQYDELTNSHNDLVKKYAYLVNNVDNSRINDIETYFKGKNLQIDEITLAKELKNHPEWAGKAGIVQNIGAEATPPIDVDERVEASRIFGVRLSKRR